jgi:hypothetical protein
MIRTPPQHNVIDLPGQIVNQIQTLGQYLMKKYPEEMKASQPPAVRADHIAAMRQALAALDNASWGRSDEAIAALRAALSDVPVQAPAPAPEWRKMAHQFDRQRMAAMAHLRTLLDNPQAHAEAARAFLAGTLAEQLASVPPPAVQDGLIGGEDPEVIRQKLRTLDVTMGGDGESVLSEVIDAATRCLSHKGK